MIHEVRLYSVVPGRIGVAYERFGEHLPRLFQRHEICNVGCWTATAGAGGPMFVYMMCYPDLAERERQWTSFYADQEWYEIRARTQGAEEATERFDLYFLRESPVRKHFPFGPARKIGGVHDFIFAEVAVGQAAIANAFLVETYLPAAAAAGAEILLVSDFITGPALPKMALMFAWPDMIARQSGWHAILGSREVESALANQRCKAGRASIGRTDSYLLEPTPFGTPSNTLRDAIWS